MLMYNGYENLDGQSEIFVNGRKIILDYKMKQIGSTAYEYVISNILISKKEREI